MLTATGHVKLVDFGTCKDMLETDLNGGEFVGTAQYMSPQAVASEAQVGVVANFKSCLLYTSPSPRDRQKSRMPSSA